MRDSTGACTQESACSTPQSPHRVGRGEHAGRSERERGQALDVGAVRHIPIRQHLYLRPAPQPPEGQEWIGVSGRAGLTCLGSRVLHLEFACAPVSGMILA